MWVDSTYREEALFKVIPSSTAYGHHHAFDRVDQRQYVRTVVILGNAKTSGRTEQEQQKLVADVIPSQVTVSGLQRVLQHLLAERISIRIFRPFWKALRSDRRHA